MLISFQVANKTVILSALPELPTLATLLVRHTRMISLLENLPLSIILKSLVLHLIRKELPFSKCSHLRNPYNDNKDVKICRDGQVIMQAFVINSVGIEPFSRVQILISTVLWVRITVSYT